MYVQTCLLIFKLQLWFIIIFRKKQTKEINLYFLFLPHTKTSIPHSLSFKQRYNNAKVDYDAKWQNWWVMGGIEMMSNCILAKLRMKTYYNNYPPNQREILMAFHLVIVVPSSPGAAQDSFHQSHSWCFDNSSLLINSILTLGFNDNYQQILSNAKIEGWPWCQTKNFIRWWVRNLILARIRMNWTCITKTANKKVLFRITYTAYIRFL